MTPAKITGNCIHGSTCTDRLGSNNWKGITRSTLIFTSEFSPVDQGLDHVLIGLTESSPGRPITYNAQGRELRLLDVLLGNPSNFQQPYMTRSAQGLELAWKSFGSKIACWGLAEFQHHTHSESKGLS